tara:strand:- start:232 stop:2127 length:1896 start_codon:yes stop_codon:yes gene_type:complete
LHRLEQTELNWVLPDPILKNDLPSLDFPEALKAVLARRGIVNNKQLKNFILPPELPNPEDHFPDLNKAVKRIITAINNAEKIAICGDYDADGMTSTALLFDTFRSLDANVITSIPDRIKEGYGLNSDTIDILHNESVDLIITVDNGISATDAINKCNQYSIDLIVSDHHKIPNNIPNIFALIHPERTPNNSPYRCLAGVGIAFIIISTLSKKISNNSFIRRSLDLFCIGTIADMSSMKGANRKLLKDSLPHLHKTSCLGLKEIIKSSGINYPKITSEDIGFKIAPMINAIGRIDNPSIIIDLLTEQNNDNAREIAIYCDNINKKRKDICNQALQEALNIIDSNNLPPFIIIAQPSWHLGIIGLLASQIMNRYHRPVGVLTSDGSGFFRASVRSPKGFNLIRALDNCSDLLKSYGGHEAAAGFSIDPRRLAKLHLKLNEIVSNNHIKDFTPRIRPDSYLNFNNINREFLESQYLLEPFGIDNPKPIFWSRNCKVVNSRKLRNGHFKVSLSQNNQLIDAVHWKSNHNYKKHEYIDIAYYLEINRWNNQDRIQLNLISSKSYEEVITINANKKIYHVYKSGSNDIVLLNSAGKELTYLDYISNKKDKYTITSINYIDRLFANARLALGDDNLFI